MPQGLFRFAETYFKPTAPLKHSAAMVGHPSHPFHSNSFYKTGPSNTGYHLSLTHNWKIKQSSLSNQPKESFGNTAQGRSLDNDHTARVILQYRNTPIQNIAMSPAQLLLHRWLRDFIPSQPTIFKPHANWIATTQNHNVSLSHPNTRLIERYNRITHNLCPLQKEQIVAIEWPTTCQWDTTGQVIETLPKHQYFVRVDGSSRITLQNCQFLKKLETTTIPFPIPSFMSETSTPNPNPHRPSTPVLQIIVTGIKLSHPTSNTTQPSTLMQKTLPPPGICRITSTQQARFKRTHPQRLLPIRDGGGKEM